MITWVISEPGGGYLTLAKADQNRQIYCVMNGIKELQ